MTKTMTVLSPVLAGGHQQVTEAHCIPALVCCDASEGLRYLQKVQTCFSVPSNILHFE